MKSKDFEIRTPFLGVGDPLVIVFDVKPSQEYVNTTILMFHCKSDLVDLKQPHVILMVYKVYLNLFHILHMVYRLHEMLPCLPMAFSHF